MKTTIVPLLCAYLLALSAAPAFLAAARHLETSSRFDRDFAGVAETTPASRGTISAMTRFSDAPTETPTNFASLFAQNRP